MESKAVVALVVLLVGLVVRLLVRLLVDRCHGVACFGAGATWKNRLAFCSKSRARFIRRKSEEASRTKANFLYDVEGWQRCCATLRGDSD